MRATYRPLPTPDYLRREVERVAASVAARGSAAAHIDRRPELEPSSWRRLVARLRPA
jgi:hypothetical protein